MNKILLKSFFGIFFTLVLIIFSANAANKVLTRKTYSLRQAIAHFWAGRFLFRMTTPKLGSKGLSLSILFLGLFGFFFQSNTLFAQNPGGVSGSNLWLKANEGATNSGTTLTGWADQTGTNTFTVNGTINYSANSINFNPVVSIDNTQANTSLPGSYLAGNTSITAVDAFAVLRKTNANSGALVGSNTAGTNYGQAIFSGESSTGMWVGNGTDGRHQHFTNSGVDPGNLALINMDVSLSASPFATARLNGESQTIIPGAQGDFTQMTFTPWIGGTNNNGSPLGWRHFRGEVAEIVLYPTSLPASDKLKIESYLAIKYGITLDATVTNYVSSAGTVLWNNTSYWNDVFGIGKDDGSGLNQTSSNSINTGSGDGTGQSGKGNIVLSNASSLDDGDFLMLGHDNAALTEQTSEVPLLGQRRVAREWFVKRTGDPGTVDLRFDILGLGLTGTAAADFKLLIDADGDFTSGAITVDASSLTGTEVAFTGVIIPDGSYLTIVTNFLPPVGPGVLGASLWLKADDGASNSGSNLTGWTDQTGINTFTVNGAPGYASNEINFNPVAVFDNDEAVTDLPGDYLAGNASISYVDGFAVFFKTNAASGALIGSATHGVKYGQQIFGGFSGNENYISNAGATDPFFRFENSSLGALQPATVVGVDLNYTSATTGELSTLNGLTQTIIGTKGFNQMNLTPWIGGTNNQGGTVPNQGWRHFRGKVAELILYPSSLTLAEKLKIQSYLAIKYGISLDASVTNYVSSAGTVLWNNTTYWHDVFGIGRDDASGLNQTQSNSINTGSGDGTGQSGKGNLVVSNVDPLTNGQFFLLGHNNAPLTEKTTEVRPGMKRLSREWLIQSINPNEPTDGRTRVNLSFDISGLNISGTKAEHFKLNVTSTRGGGLANPSAFNGTTVKFDGISLSNGDIITLVTHSPGPGVEGAGLWLVGDDVIELSSGSLSGRWPDRTITNEMIYQGNLFTRPAVPDINFHKTVDFDGNDYLGGTYSITFQTLYAVVKHDRANGNEDAIIGTQQGGRMMEGFELNSQPSVSGDWNFKIDNGPNQSYFTQQGRLGVVNIVDGQPIASQKIYLDGTSYNASGLSTSNPISFTGIPEIGRFQGDLGQRFFDGQIAEVIMYPTAHTDEERNKVQSYLAIKYGITLDPSIGSYVNSSGNSIWNHAAYWHDVFGIGKDNGNGLDQAQSNSINTGSGNGTGQSGKGNIVLRDATSLDDGDFLVIGHDNQELSPQFIDLPSGLLSFRIKREWKVQRTGDPGTVTLEFNFLDLLGNNGTSGDYLLLIDEDGNGDFTNGTVTQIPATSYVNNIAKFTNVNLPDGAVFTFTTAQTKGPGVLGTDLWVKANEGVTLSGNNLSAWTDQAGINTFSVNGTVSLDSNAVNFNPAVDFTNTNSSGFPENSISGNTSVPAVEVFGVFKYKSLAEQGTILGSTTDATAIFGGTFNTMKMGNGTNNQIYSNPLVSSGFSINSSDFSPSLANVRINGASSTVTQDVGVDFSEVNLNVPLIGGSQSQFNKLNGQLAELIVYPSSLSDANRGIVESYLAIKYGITLDSAVGKYVNAAGTTLWDNATYWNDVFGIGKEDASGLNQVASNSINTGSGDGTGQSGKGNIVVSNPSSLDDGDFLLMGHDNGNLAEQSTEVPVLGWKRLGREWQVKRTGDPGSVNLSFDISGLTLTGNKATQYILLVDTDSDFSTGATEIRASALSGNKVEFDGVSLPDGAFFTLVTYKVVDPGVADASLWLKADQGVFTSGSTLTNWIDQTGINQFTVAGNPGSQVSAINFNPSVIFTNNSGTLVNLPVNRLTGDTRITYVDGFAVYKLDPSRVNGLGTLIGGTDRLTTGQFPDDNYGKAIFSATPQDGPNKYTVYAGTGIPGQFQWYDNTTIPKTAFAINNLDVGINTSPFATGRINGKNQTIQAGGQGDFSSIDLVPMIGGTTNFYENGWNPFAGQVTEIVLFDRSLTSEEKLKVESYLAVKYGITLDPSVTNYLSSTGAVLWNSPTYWHDVFGLGKDDANGLNQTRSNSINTGSGDGTGQSGKGNIVLSNASSLDNGDFILIGHDNAPLTEQITDLPNGLQKLRLSREWKVKRTGDPGTVSLAFNTLGLTLSSSSLSQLILLIDEDGNGDFTNGPVTQVTASTFANNVITFDGVGLADNVVFTIITGSNSGPAVKGAELWLKGDSGVNPGSGTLTQWTDQTGFNNFSVSGDPQTGTSAFNFNNAIDFDGSGDYLTGDEPITFQTLYAVIKRASDLPNDDLQGVVVGAKSSFTDPTRGVGVIMQGNYLTTLNNEFLPSDFVAIQSDGGKFGSSLRLGVVEIVDGPFDQSKSFVDGTFYPMKRAPFSLAQGTLLKPYLAIPFIGRQFQSGMPYYFKGQIAELIMYPASHTPAERNIIESYLAVKYGITLDPFVGQYVNSSGNTIWNNTAYWHDVFGIGKDDGSGLNQPSSNSINTGSGDGTGQSGKGNIVLSNPTSLDAGDFLMIGHDDGALTTQTSDLPASLGAFRLTREWKVKRTGDPGSLD
ncbi:MAG: hypothetical protein HWE09_08330, partial [Cyclobacteriaceae bacterium]|nr:hypothetical protein [Cyclobacteriaceae bacterium]